LFVRASGYLEATGPFGEQGPFELPLLRLLRARGPAMQDFCCVQSWPLQVAEAWGWQKKMLWCFTVMVSQIGVFILKVGRALPSRLAMPSLLQGSHSQTGTHVVHGERMRRRIAGSSPFFVSLF